MAEIRHESGESPPHSRRPFSFPALHLSISLVEPHNEANDNNTIERMSTVSKSKTPTLLATAVLAMAAFGATPLAHAGLGMPQKHPDGLRAPQKHPDIIGVLRSGSFDLPPGPGKAF